MLRMMKFTKTHRFMAIDVFKCSYMRVVGGKATEYLSAPRLCIKLLRNWLYEQPQLPVSQPVSDSLGPQLPVLQALA